jgi:hypothetical protein
MSRLFLAAGVAALAIAAPAAAGPGGDHGHGGGGGGGNPHAEAPHGGGGGNPHAEAPHGGGGGGGPRAFAAPHGGGGGGGERAFAAPRMQRQGFAPRVERQQRFAVERPQRIERVQMRQQAQARFAQREQMRGNRHQAQARFAQRQQIRANRQQAQARMAERQQMRVNRQQALNLRAQRVQQAQNMRAEHFQQAQNVRAQRFQQANRQQQFQAQMAQRQQLEASRFANVNGRFAANNGVGFGVGGCPPGLANKGCMPPGLAAKELGQMSVGDRVAAIRTLGDARFAPFDFAPQRQILDPFVAEALVGVPVATAETFGTFEPFPAGLSYLYPPTPAYYYEFGNGYAYQVDRSTSLIDALIPLLAGGFLPGTYLPQSYMSSYVPDYYGLNSFYPANYDYGYGYDGGDYGNVCNRYADGVIYQVDCDTGFVENVIPMYAGGYGVGQLLPSAYSYYNVPMQYRSLYYPTADYSYWYAPGAIYQYDPRTSLITSVAALMSPGFSIGQPLPAGYDVYNVPYDYRSTYYDTPTAWYRYNNGNIYQVDPTTQLVTAIVASLLT